MTNVFVLRGIVVTLVMVVLAWSDQSLSGKVTGKIGPGVFIITDVISVPDGKSLTILPGTTFKFQNYSGIAVDGELLIRGTPEEPIVFTSFRDNAEDAKPEAFDWNGIKVTPIAKQVIFENIIMKYSTFGINIESERTPVQIRRVTFRYNGYANISRSGKIIIAADGMPVNYFWPDNAHVPDSEIETHAVNKKPLLNPDNGPKDDALFSSWHAPTRIGCALIGLGGAVMWGVGQSSYNKKSDLYYKSTNPTMVSRYNSERNSALALRNAAIALVMLGAGGFTVTYLF
jgi:hypothetical protein